MSTPKRFFLDKIVGDEIAIEGEEFLHAKTVLRLCEGSEIVLLDGSGKEYSAIVSKVEKRRLLAHIVGSTVGDKEPNTEIYLLCGALKGDKTELVVQKACELGVGKIGIFSSEFCSAYMNENKLERLNKVAKEAAKQCLRSRVPSVVYFDNLADALESAKDYENKFFACEFLTENEFEIKELKGSSAVVVGSEGGFSEREFALSKQLGYSGLWLGKRILRAETAAIATTAIIAHALGEI